MAVTHILTSGTGEKANREESMEPGVTQWDLNSDAPAASSYSALASNHTSHLREPVSPLLGFSFFLVMYVRKQNSNRYRVIAFQF